MFLESSIKNAYIPVMRQMRTNLIPEITARSLLAKGVADVAWTTRNLLQHGFSEEDAGLIVASATVEKTQATRDLSLAAIRELYADQEISADDATQMLMSLGYDENEAAWELALADMARVRTYRNSVITRVRSGFVKGLLTEQDVVTTLDALGVPPARRDTLLSIWQIEMQTVTRDLTPAQIVSAAKKGIMLYADSLARLVGQGYAQQDAQVLLALSGLTA
jgi:hypothetical protein